MYEMLRDVHMYEMLREGVHVVAVAWPDFMGTTSLLSALCS